MQRFFSLGMLIIGHHLFSGAGLVTRELSPSAHSSDVHAPNLIIAGIGDSGTRGVKELMEKLGVQMCEDVNDSQDNIRTDPLLHPRIVPLIQHLIQLGGHELSAAAYEKDADAFQELLAWQRRQVTATKSCALRNSEDSDVIWGFKNPQQLYMWPITEHAYANHSKLLLVARDPRDICTSDNQNQFNLYCKSMMGRACTGELDCYSFWAQVWSNVLTNFVPKGNVKLVRIEDLTVPIPSLARPKVECLLRFAGLRQQGSIKSWISFLNPMLFGQDAIEKALHPMHEHSSSYMGHHHGATEQDRRRLVAVTSNHSNPLVQQTMLSLGYDPLSFTLTTPLAGAMC
mmetsp:Transcript_147778/g.275399  ORF Transcript_147778/g.275399 Transcript_147778/m.275399 type:complete len:343 (-) Transcript_147778:39-1067(-)